MNSEWESAIGPGCARQGRSGRERIEAAKAECRVANWGVGRVDLPMDDLTGIVRCRSEAGRAPEREQISVENAE
jgi:hypothetical protein